MRGKQSGVTSDAMSGPYRTAIGAITLEDTMETTRGSQQLQQPHKHVEIIAGRASHQGSVIPPLAPGIRSLPRVKG